MDVIEAIKTRRSIRKFQNRKIAHNITEKIISAALSAPSWRNTQIPYYFAIENEVIKKNLIGDAVEWNQKIIDSAPLVLVLACKKNLSGCNRDGVFETKRRESWAMFDCGIAAYTIVLAAHYYGLGSVILGRFDPDHVKTVIGISDELDVIALIAFGYSNEEPEEPLHKKVQDVLEYI